MFLVWFPFACFVHAFLTGGNAFLPNAGGFVVVFCRHLLYSSRDSPISFCSFYSHFQDRAIELNRPIQRKKKTLVHHFWYLGSRSDRQEMLCKCQHLSCAMCPMAMCQLISCDVHLVHMSGSQQCAAMIKGF